MARRRRGLQRGEFNRWEFVEESHDVCAKDCDQGSDEEMDEADFDPRLYPYNLPRLL